MSHPIAHEGNPRQTPDLTITGGSVLSTASLAITFLGPAVPLIPPPVENEFAATASNPEKYTFTNFVYGADGDNTGAGIIGAFEPNSTTNAITSTSFVATSGTVFEYSKKDNIYMSGCVISAPIRWSSHFIDNDITETLGNLAAYLRDHNDQDFKQTWDFLQQQSVVQAGFRWGEYPGNTNPNSISMQAIAFLQANAIGKPFSGVAICVDPDSTSDNFTGIVGAFNWADQTQYLYRYDHQPLNKNPTILATLATGADIAEDGAMWLIGAKNHATGAWSIRWPGGTAISGLTDTDIPFYDFDMRVALVNLPSTIDSGQDDAVLWTEVSGLIWAD